MKNHLAKLAVFMCAAVFALSAQAVERTVFVHLFEWQWNDIAAECENVLGPNGFAAVQVSPPQKSVSGSQWWTRYQPVSYAVEGRSGSRAEFASMVSRCKAVGVGIYVDIVGNHMAAGNRNFPEVPYGINDFHSCTGAMNYSDAWSVQNCDLVGLNDLKTESDYVRGKIAAYMNDLTSLGVAGFRIDAAKHMAAADVANIISRLQGQPYVFQEVIGAAGEPLQPNQYSHIADVTEFNFTNSLGYYFKGRGPLKTLSNIGTSNWNSWLSSGDAVVFVANHDNQRQNTENTITHKDGANLNNIAHVFMMGWPYGYPKIMSSYDWVDHDQGPPSSGASACNNGWLCEHRIRAIKNMVAFRNNTSPAFRVTNYWDNGNNQMAWGRGGLGYVAINRENSGSLNRTFATGMAAGSYCDIIHADFNYATGACSGATIQVDSNGNANFSVASHDAVAFHVGAKVGVACLSCGGGNGNTGSSANSSSVASSVPAADAWYFRGTPNNWGAKLMPLLNGLYCTTQDFGAASTNPRFKVDHFANWAESYPSADYVVAANSSYRICINAQTHAITATLIVTSSSPASSSPASSKPASSLAATSSAASSSAASGTVNVTFVCNQGTTYSGQSVYAVGSLSALGNWSAAQAIKLTPSSYPTWSGTVALPANTSVQWKCLKRDELNATAGVQWQSGANNSLTTTAGATTTGSF
jgi:alpha-amylase